MIVHTLHQDKWFPIKGIYLVHIKPRLFFSELSNNPKILLPWLYIIIVILVSYLITGDIEKHFELEHTFKNDTAIKLAISTNMLKTFIFLSKICLVLNALFISSLAFFFVGKKNHIKFKLILSMMLYGEVIFTTGILLSLPITLLTGNLYPFSLAPFVLSQGYESTSILFFLAIKLSPFFIHEIVCVGIGFSRLLESEIITGIKISMLTVGSFSIFMILFKLLSTLTQ